MKGDSKNRTQDHWDMSELRILDHHQSDQLCLSFKNDKDFILLGWLHSTEIAYLLLTQQPRVHFSEFPRIFLLMLLIFIDGTA